MLFASRTLVLSCFSLFLSPSIIHIEGHDFRRFWALEFRDIYASYKLPRNQNLSCTLSCVGFWVSLFGVDLTKFFYNMAIWCLAFLRSVSRTSFSFSHRDINSKFFINLFSIFHSSCCSLSFESELRLNNITESVFCLTYKINQGSDWFERLVPKFFWTILLTRPQLERFVLPGLNLPTLIGDLDYLWKAKLYVHSKPPFVV